ncbi:hypothetical protein BDW72DRAFT_202583 [Aspergillus terricola var. indicus]
MFMNTNFVALKHVSQTYGVQTGPDEWAILTRWQSALFQDGQCSAFVGPGFFIDNSPAHTGEIVPLRLRAACTATLQMSWSIRSIIVAGATYGYNKMKNGLAMMERTVKIEESMGGLPTLFDLINLTKTCLQFVANACSWGLRSWLQRRTFFLYGAAASIIFLFNHKTLTHRLSGCDHLLHLCWGAGSHSYTIILELSAVRLRALSTAVGRTLLGSAGMFGMHRAVVLGDGYFFLPELKHRSYREADICSTGSSMGVLVLNFAARAFTQN